MHSPGSIGCCALQSMQFVTTLIFLRVHRGGTSASTIPTQTGRCGLSALCGPTARLLPLCVGVSRFCNSWVAACFPVASASPGANHTSCDSRSNLGTPRSPLARSADEREATRRIRRAHKRALSWCFAKLRRCRIYAGMHCDGLWASRRWRWQPGRCSRSAGGTR